MGKAVAVPLYKAEGTQASAPAFWEEFLKRGGEYRTQNLLKKAGEAWLI